MTRMTPAEHLILLKLREAEAEGYEYSEAVQHVANLLGLSPSRVEQLLHLV
jgi:hypothetical protein